MREGWIKLHRKIEDWRWYGDPTTKVVFFHLLLIANFEDAEWKNINIKRGQCIIGYPALASKLGISVQNVRTSLSRLKSTGEVTVKSTNKYSIVTLCNYDAYNNQKASPNSQANSQDNTQLTGNQQSTNNSKEEEEFKKEKKTTTKGFVPPVLEEVNNYIKHNNLNVNGFTFMKFFQCAEPPWTDSNGKPVRNWKQKLITWSDGKNAREGIITGRNGKKPLPL